VSVGFASASMSGEGQIPLRLLSQLTIAGSRWSKKREAPVSIVAIRDISSSVSAKSKTSKFLLHAFTTD
jgi:hypothetical protein